MPRKKPVGDEQVLNPVLPVTLALPGPRGPHHRDHAVDAYEAPPGAVLVHPPTHEPLKRKPTKADDALRKTMQAEQATRISRYDRYLDALEEYGGDTDAALAVAYPDYAPEAIAEQREYLLEDVRSTIGVSSIASELERNDLNDRARVRLLRKHAYSANPAASLKALDAISDLAGSRSDIGSFEATLRLAKGQM